MKLRKSIWVTGVSLIAVILSSCNLGATPAPTVDVASVQSTVIAQVLATSNAQLTQTAAVALPTNTPIPTNTLAPITVLSTNTPIPFDTPLTVLTPLVIPTITLGAIATTTTKNGCNDGLYLGEDPHYTDQFHYLEVGIGEVVEQFFHLKNTGTCNWDEGYGFYFKPEYSSPELTGNNVILPKNKPGDYTAVGNEVRYKAIVKAPKVAGDYSAFWKMKADDGSEFGPLVSLYIRVRQP